MRPFRATFELCSYVVPYTTEAAVECIEAMFVRMQRWQKKVHENKPVLTRVPIPEKLSVYICGPLFTPWRMVWPCVLGN